ncbi:dipeptidase [Pontivivens ytuae]|uniref:Dipeptidase n=1 Tax=Pontivivens ytuae TaxID=2789856 RepID=A0A7S9LUW1_9RHOB|nr:dipeptidase [Pontivivens ytuae]QPH55694.1 dipeptidase [Pontivivens ytuae]
MPRPPIFDGHNDCLLRLMRAGGRPALGQFREGGPGHVDLPKAREGGFAGGFFAIFVPDTGPFYMEEMLRPEYDLPLAEMVAEADALPIALHQAGLLLELDRRGDLRLCRSAAEIRAAMADGQLAAVMHMEGAEAIGPDLDALDVLHAAGLRSLGPVWSRETIFGHGVPFRYPSTADTGPGLTEAGQRLVARCADMRIMVDTSHLTERGFWDIAEAGVPLIATHSNAHAICPQARNVSDAQLRAIGETGGMVGLNFAGAFLRPDGQMRAEGALEWMVRHLDHMLAMAGEDHVGLGSDFDGAVIPAEIGSTAGLDALRQAMEQHGYGDRLIEKICHANWLACCERLWGE